MWTKITQRLGMPLTLVLGAALALVGGSLLANHWQHAVSATPLLILGVCVVMHLLMHRHGGHG